MSEKEIIENAKYFISIDILYGGRIVLLKSQLKFYQNTIQELLDLYNNLKEIEKSHQEEDGKLRVELEQEKEKNKELQYQNKILQEKNQDYKCNYDTMAEQKEKALEKVKQLEEHQKQYLDGELITAKQGKFFEKMIKENYISKDKIKEKLNYQYMLWNTPNRQKEYNQEVVEVLEDLLEEK